MDPSDPQQGVPGGTVEGKSKGPKRWAQALRSKSRTLPAAQASLAPQAHPPPSTPTPQYKPNPLTAAASKAAAASDTSLTPAELYRRQVAERTGLVSTNDPAVSEASEVRARNERHDLPSDDQEDSDDELGNLLTGAIPLNHAALAALAEAEGELPTRRGHPKTDSSESYPPFFDPSSLEMLPNRTDLDLDLVYQELDQWGSDDSDSGMREPDAKSLKQWAQALLASQRRAADEAKLSPPRPILKRAMSTSILVGSGPNANLVVPPTRARSASNGDTTTATTPSKPMGQVGLTQMVQTQVASVPVTNNGRGVMFSDADKMHATWPADVYDRRGGPATCNLLTPQLAQHIKEELNAFKMEEMVVAPSSRVFTQFFV